jgi:hypothetical protein
MSQIGPTCGSGIHVLTYDTVLDEFQYLGSCACLVHKYPGELYLEKQRTPLVLPSFLFNNSSEIPPSPLAFTTAPSSRPAFSRPTRSFPRFVVSVPLDDHRLAPSYYPTSELTRRGRGLHSTLYTEPT